MRDLVVEPETWAGLVLLLAHVTVTGATLARIALAWRAERRRAAWVRLRVTRWLHAAAPHGSPRVSG